MQSNDARNICREPLGDYRAEVRILLRPQNLDRFLELAHGGDGFLCQLVVLRFEPPHEETA